MSLTTGWNFTETYEENSMTDTPSGPPTTTAPSTELSTEEGGDPLEAHPDEPVAEATETVVATPTGASAEEEDVQVDMQ